MASRNDPAPAGPSPLIVHLSTEHGWRGGERQIWFLARGLAARGWRQVIAAPAESLLAERIGRAGLRMVPLHHRFPYHPGNLIRIAALCQGHRRVILHAHTSPSLTLAALTSRFRTGILVVHTRRVAFPIRRGTKYHRAADIYVAISRAIADAFAAAGTPADRVRVIPSAVDLDQIDRAQPVEELRHAAGDPIVCCVAHLSHEKGLGVLLAAWAEVIRKRPGAKLMLIGDGPERQSLEKAAAAIPGGSLVFAGFQDDVASWIKACDLYVQPSLAEGLGSSVLDAMGCRLAVVASATGGLPDAVEDGVTGLLVPPGEPEPLAQAILDLLAHPDRARAMGHAGRARIEATFSIPSMIEAYARLYHELA